MTAKYVVYNGRPVPFVDIRASAITSGGGGFGLKEHYYNNQRNDAQVQMIIQGQVLREMRWYGNPAYPDCYSYLRLSAGGMYITEGVIDVGIEVRVAYGDTKNWTEFTVDGRTDFGQDWRRKRLSEVLYSGEPSFIGPHRSSVE